MVLANSIPDVSHDQHGVRCEEEPAWPRFQFCVQVSIWTTQVDMEP